MRAPIQAVLLLLVASLPREAGASPASVVLSGSVLGSSGKHPVYVALWDAASFLRKPVRSLKIVPGSPTSFSFAIEPGRWALSAYEDMNENGILDMGIFGPKEPNGFWRAFARRRRPTFDDVGVLVTTDTPGADIRLK